MRPVLPGNRYRVTVITRRDRRWPFQLRVVDRWTGTVTREVLRGLPLRSRQKVHALAAEREARLNERGGRAPDKAPLPWPEVRGQAEAQIRAEVRRSTANEYRWAVLRFERYVAETIPKGLRFADQVDGALARRFVAWRRGQRVEAVTVNKDVRNLKAVWGYLAAVGAATGENPWASVPRLEEFKRVRRRLSLTERSALLAAAVAEGPKFLACLALELDTAMRVRELSHLTWRHVDLAHQRVQVTREPCGWEPKDHEEGILCLSAETATILGAIGDERLKVLGASGLSPTNARQVLRDERVFGVGRRPGADPWERTYNAGLRRSCAAAGIPPILSHGIRRTVARHARDAGAEGYDIQRLLRHSSYRTTQGYVGDDQADAAARAFQAGQSGMCVKRVPKALPPPP